MSSLILVIDDEAPIRELIRYNLVRADYRVLLAESGKEAVAYASTVPIDLVVLDLMLPDMTGFEVCRQIRANSRVPILVVTARQEEVTRVRALEVGADDYVAKPFSPQELVARVGAHLRRWSWQESRDEPSAEMMTVGPLQLDLAGRRLFQRGVEVHTTPMEFDLLQVLCRTPGRVVARERLLSLATGQAISGSARNIDVHVRSLRMKLEDDPANPRLLVTVRGFGYCVRPEVLQRSEAGLA